MKNRDSGGKSCLLPIVKSNAKNKTPHFFERESIKESQLPSNWRDYPAPEKLANIGTNWIKSKSSLLLDIPSAVVEKENNTLINPLHPDMKFVNLVNNEKFLFDSRLFKSGVI